MIITLATLLVNLFGLDEKKALAIVRWAVPGVLAAVLITVAILFYSCRHREPKVLTPEEFQTAKQAIADGERKKAEEVLAQKDVTVKAIDANLANAETTKLNTLADARKKYSQMSDAELAAALDEQK